MNFFEYYALCRSSNLSRVEFLVTQSKLLPAGQNAMKRFLLATLIIRLYELLKNDSRFFRIADASYRRITSISNEFYGDYIGGG